MKELIWSLVALGIVVFMVGATLLFFLPTIIELLINGAFLYFIFLKTSADIRKRNRLKMYFISGVIAAVFLSLVGNIFPFFWSLTTWSVVTMFIVILALIIFQNKK